MILRGTFLAVRYVSVVTMEMRSRCSPQHCSHHTGQPGMDLIWTADTVAYDSCYVQNRCSPTSVGQRHAQDGYNNDEAATMS